MEGGRVRGGRGAADGAAAQEGGGREGIQWGGDEMLQDALVAALEARTAQETERLKETSRSAMYIPFLRNSLFLSLSLSLSRSL